MDKLLLTGEFGGYVVQGWDNFQTVLCERVPLAGIVHPQQARDPAASEGRSGATAHVEMFVMHGWHRDARAKASRDVKLSRDARIP